jgi:hypothetical protein
MCLLKGANLLRFFYGFIFFFFLEKRKVFVILAYVVLGGSSICGCRVCWRLGVHLVECACVIELPKLKVCDGCP